jgi:hypothetical protein
VLPGPGDASRIVTRRAVGGPGGPPDTLHLTSVHPVRGPGGRQQPWPGPAAAAVARAPHLRQTFLLELAMKKIDELS